MVPHGCNAALGDLHDGIRASSSIAASELIDVAPSKPVSRRCDEVWHHIAGQLPGSTSIDFYGSDEGADTLCMWSRAETG